MSAREEAEIERLAARRAEIRRLQFAARNHTSERAHRRMMRLGAEDSALMVRIRELMAQFPN